MEMDKVIDKLAEKLGVAVDQLRPLGEQAIHEYVIRSRMYAGGCFLMGVACLLMTIIIFRHAILLRRKRPNDYYDESTGWFIGAAMATIPTLLLIGVGLGYLADSFAPLIGLLGK